MILQNWMIFNLKINKSWGNFSTIRWQSHMATSNGWWLLFCYTILNFGFVHLFFCTPYNRKYLQIMNYIFDLGVRHSSVIRRVRAVWRGQNEFSRPLWTSNQLFWLYCPWKRSQRFPDSVFCKIVTQRKVWYHLLFAVISLEKDKRERIFPQSKVTSKELQQKSLKLKITIFCRRRFEYAF